MSATNRVSAVFSPETTYAQGGSNWLRLPAGVTLSLTPSNNFTYLTSIGSRFFETGVAGKFSGTGSLAFKLDYNIIDFLPAIFEEYTYDSSTGTHTFANLNGSRPPSFAIRYKKLNRIVGGPADETTELRGCVASALSIKQTSSTATLDVTLRFTYNNQVSVYSDLSETDFDDYYETVDPLPVEWTCLFVGDESVAGTESSGFDVSNNLGTVAGCGTRFDSNYYVGKVEVSISTSVYSTDPKRYLTLMYSGGYDDTLTSPQDKALRPIPEVSLRSSETVDSDTYSCIATFEDVYVNAGGATSFTDSKVVDSPTLKAKSVTLSFRNTRGRITAWD